MKDFILNNYKRMTVREMSEFLGVSISVIHHTIDNMGLRGEVNRYNCYRTIDETKFEVMDEDCYYLFGFMLADGSIRGHALNITLSSKEEEFLRSVGERFSYRGGFARSDGNGYGVETIQLNFTSKIVSEKFRELGLVENKTGIESYRNIPDEMFSHVLRGFWDGDGNVVKNAVRIYSYSDVVYKFSEDANRIWGINSHPLKGRGQLKLVTFNCQDIRTIYKDVYPEGCLCLQRKRDAIEKIVNMQRKKSYNRVGRDSIYVVDTGEEVLEFTSRKELMSRFGLKTSDVSTAIYGTGRVKGLNILIKEVVEHATGF